MIPLVLYRRLPSNLEQSPCISLPRAVMTSLCHHVENMPYVFGVYHGFNCVFQYFMPLDSKQELQAQAHSREISC